MSRVPTRKLVLFAILAAANVVILVGLSLRRLGAPAQLTLAAGNLPAIEVLDDTGNRVVLSSLTGKALVLQFVNPQIAQQIDAVTKLLSSFESSEVQIILITQSSQELRRLLPELPENVTVVQHDYAELKRAFKVPDCCERRFVFDGDGKLQYRDYYYEGDLTPRVNVLIRKTLRPASAAISDVLNSSTTGTFSSLREQTRHTTSGKAVVIFFTSVSSTCPSGELVKLVGKYTQRQDVTFVVLLPRDYSNTDRENFSANFRVKLTVEQFDPDLEDKWASLVSVYGEPKINGSVVFINRGDISVANGLIEVERDLSRL
jgi:peroxiredoxin